LLSIPAALGQNGFLFDPEYGLQIHAEPPLGQRLRQSGQKQASLKSQGLILPTPLSRKKFMRSIRKETPTTTDKYIMTTALEATEKDFEQMMHMLAGFWVTQIAGAVATYSIGDHLAKGPASAEQISKIAGIDSIAAVRLLCACASLGLVAFDGVMFSASSTPIRSPMAVIEPVAA
jgi:hypothetical protein